MSITNMVLWFIFVELVLLRGVTFPGGEHVHFGIAHQLMVVDSRVFQGDPVVKPDSGLNLKPVTLLFLGLAVVHWQEVWGQCELGEVGPQISFFLVADHLVYLAAVVVMLFLLLNFGLVLPILLTVLLLLPDQ